ncbi:MAG: fumarylacetoacetate hydrolase family protein [Firmicutes bacterium]|nr:fumarylacetoacetate hydrolase family protein [Bacillota bacterium]
MNFVTYEISGQRQLGAILPDGQNAVSLQMLGVDQEYKDMVDFITNVSEVELLMAERAWHQEHEAAIPLDRVTLLAPITRPIHDIICVGINYRSHQEEARDMFQAATSKKDEQHIYFGKRANRITGHGEAIVCPSCDEEMDYEAELAVIIGKECRDIKPEEAEEYIFGYSVFNDVSARAIQRKHVQWLRGKSLDGYSVMGPSIVHKSQIAFPPQLDISCHVNGELRQQSNTRMLIADISTIISELSQGMTLEPGDIIATGTPSGVGMGFTPPKYIKAGDEVVCTIEGVGTLRNVVK